MTRIYQNVYVGTVQDYEDVKDNVNFYIIGAAKEPFHRNAVGYSGRSCGSDHPEYLYAKRERLLALNLVDVSDVKFISQKIIETAISAIEDAAENNTNVLICCNQGRSRSAVIGLLYMKRQGFYETYSFEETEKHFKGNVYPEYEPNEGMREYARIHWDDCE